jgi:hypothetical protein
MSPALLRSRPVHSSSLQLTCEAMQRTKLNPVYATCNAHGIERSPPHVMCRPCCVPARPFFPIQIRLQRSETKKSGTCGQKGNVWTKGERVVLITTPIDIKGNLHGSEYSFVLHACPDDPPAIPVGSIIDLSCIVRRKAGIIISGNTGYK